MKIEIGRVDDNVRFEALNAEGHSVVVDGPALADGSGGQGMRPMQLLLTAMAICASFDVVGILKKQRQLLKDINITAEGSRAEDVVPKPFTAIHLSFRLFGQIDPGKAEKAIELAIHKYCSVGASLNPEIPVTYSFTIEN